MVDILTFFIAVMAMWVCRWHDKFNFCNRHEWQEAKEEKEKHAEQAEGTEKGENIDHGRRVVTPARWQKVVGQRSDSDHEAFEPHANVNENRHDPDDGCIGTDLFEPEELWRKHIAAEHDVVGPGILTESAVNKGEAFVWIRTVPGDKELHDVGVTDDRTGAQADLTHVIDVTLRNQVV